MRDVPVVRREHGIDLTLDAKELEGGVVGREVFGRSVRYR